MEEILVNLPIEEILSYIYKELLDDDTTSAENVAGLLSDGKLGNNDLEQIFIYEPYDPSDGTQVQTVFQELSSRLALIDRRLDCTNELLAQGFGFIGAFCVCIVSMKFFGWLYNVLGV